MDGVPVAKRRPLYVAFDGGSDGTGGAMEHASGWRGRRGSLRLRHTRDCVSVAEYIAIACTVVRPAKRVERLQAMQFGVKLGF